ncbi:MAG: helix-turn-helix domain-containing protein [Lysobacteraceae bacterium]
MNLSIPALQATALCLSLFWLGLALVSRPRRPLNTVWALFCGSIALFMAHGLVGPGAGAWYVLFGAGACFTCNGFWLVARALFREGRPFASSHVWFVGLIALLIILSQRDVETPLQQLVEAVLSLLSSTTLVLAFWEGVRGFSRQRGTERAMRLVFLATYGGCTGIALLLPIVIGSSSRAAALCAAAAAAIIVFVTQGLVTWRLRNPLVSSALSDIPETLACEANVCATADVDSVLGAEYASDAVIRDEDAALARTLERHMRQQQPYLQPELKLSHLAQALGVSEYRISRVIHDVLGHRNISQYVNGFRLEHAQALLNNRTRDEWSTLVIGLESGFGSLGAFHRAFKAATGYPPGEFRAMRQASAAMHGDCVRIIGA